MTNLFHLIGCASSIAGVDEGTGLGPLVIQSSNHWNEPVPEIGLQWDAMYTADQQNNIAMDERLRNLYLPLAEKISTSLRAKNSLCVIGGDHSCAIGTWSGAYDALHSQGDLGLIWIDAHMDSHVPETSGSSRVHGMPLAALLGHGFKSLTSILHEEPKFKPENVCLIGVRSFEPEEEALLKRLNVSVYHMDDIRQKGFTAVIAEALEKVNRNTIGYGVTIDIDSFDPTEAPGVDVPEPNGLFMDVVGKDFQKLFADPRLILTEIVEFNPNRDVDQQTEKLIILLLKMIIQHSNKNKLSTINVIPTQQKEGVDKDVIY